MELADFLERGERALADAVAASRVEDLYLDFKGGRDALFRDGALTKDGRRSLARAVSAFSNSAGGLVVIGVDCRRLDGVDAASALSPVEQLEKARSALNNELGSLVQPRNDGVRLHHAPSASQPDSGYLVVEVPRSERRPHMSTFERTYHKRSNASSFVMEHYDVEDAFRRIASPLLVLSRTLSVKPMNGVPAIVIDFALRNQGVATAKHVQLTIRRVGGCTLRIESPLISEWNVRAGNSGVVISSDRLVINPGQVVEFHRASLELGKDAMDQPSIAGFPPSTAFVEVEFEISAENMWPAKGLHRIEALELLPLVLA